MGYHLVNVLLHSAVCFLYVQLCGVVFGEAWPALIAGLLFAVHPIHTEAVSTTYAMYAKQTELYLWHADVNFELYLSLYSLGCGFSWKG